MVNKLEALISKAGRELADYQAARLFKVPESWVATPCDFFGYTADGRAILIEAKMVTRTSLPISCAPGLKVHQWNALLEANRANCLALICWAQRGTCATITVDMAAELSRGRRSIKWTQIDERYHHSMGGAHAHFTLLEPWLSTVLA